MRHKLPAMMFYFGDWFKAIDLRMCSLEARGLWIDLLGMMWEGDNPGYLSNKGLPLKDTFIGSFLGIPENKVKILLKELEENGVFSKTEDGVIFCRRMVKDVQKREKCKVAGKKGGGNPILTFKGSLLKPPIKETFKGTYEDEYEAEYEAVNKDVVEDKSSISEGERVKREGKGEKKEIPYQEILDDLNSLIGSNYKSTTQKTRDLIKARWNEEGFRLEDFKTVHRKKVEEWGVDDKMRPYLRPVTLYGTKFESYFNQPEKLPVSNRMAKNMLVAQEWLKEKQEEEKGKNG